MKNKTLDYYEQNAEAFCKNTIHADTSELYYPFLNYIPPRGCILDLGCGSGRDSKAFKEKGYHVVAVDGAKAICDLASAYIGQTVQCKCFQEIDDIESFDGIWACASLLHVRKQEMPEMLQRLSKALKKEGVLYVSFKYGSNEYVKHDRFFNNYTESDIEPLFCRENGLACIQWSITDDVRVGCQEKWLNVIARRQEIVK